MLELNTPFSTERLSAATEDHIEHVAPSDSVVKRKTTAKEGNSKMANQTDHPTLLIPGPIEFDDAVLKSMSHYRYVWHAMPVYISCHEESNDFFQFSNAHLTDSGL